MKLDSRLRLDPALRHRLRAHLDTFGSALDDARDRATPENLHALRDACDELMRAAAGLILALSPEEVPHRSLEPG